jgi:hypothetical protein
MPQIQIDNPCNEKWNRMKVRDGGRLCLSCNKVVVDFTKKSEKEIIEYFTQKADDSICGKYRAEHVTTPRKSGKFKWMITVLALIFGTSFISSCRKHVVGKKMKWPILINHVNAESQKSSGNG